MTAMLDDPDPVIDRYPTRISSEILLMKRNEPTVWGSPEDGPITEDDLAGFGTSGFLAVSELLTPAEVDECLEELERRGSDSPGAGDDRTSAGPHGDEVRTVFGIHSMDGPLGKLARDPRLADRARQILGSDVYVHQSRISYRPGFSGKGFYWHSDFEAWHVQDGMPAMRAVGISINLADEYPHNGSLMIMPGSHRTFVSCAMETQPRDDGEPLYRLEIRRPDNTSLATLGENGIVQFPGKAGSAVIFDSNCMHGSVDNITPFPRSNVFIVFNSVENTLVEPFGPGDPRPEYIASRDFTPVG
jgi:ectoine hydroxylase